MELLWNLTTNTNTINNSGVHHELPASVSYFYGFLMIIVFTLGLAENAIVLFVYAKTPKLRKANMSFVIGLAVSDMGQTVLNIPFVAAACFNRRWIFGHSGCMYIGFVTTWFGLSQISLLCVIALERYFVIVHQTRKLSATETRSIMALLACFLYGAGWATGPLLGWSGYKLVAGEISCSLSWKIKNDLHLSYVLSLFAFVWFLPLSVIIFAYIRIAQLIFRGKATRQNMKLNKRTTRERKVAMTVLLMVGAFVLSWSPYSVIALLMAFGDISHAPIGVYLVPAAFAKASIIWNPIIYIARHNEFRRAFAHTRRRLFAHGFPCIRRCHTSATPTITFELASGSLFSHTCAMGKNNSKIYNSGISEQIVQNGVLKNASRNMSTTVQMEVRIHNAFENKSTATCKQTQSDVMTNCITLHPLNIAQVEDTVVSSI